jgi:hypothetical protein
MQANANADKYQCRQMLMHTNIYAGKGILVNKGCGRLSGKQMSFWTNVDADKC